MHTLMVSFICVDSAICKAPADYVIYTVEPDTKGPYAAVLIGGVSGFVAEFLFHYTVGVYFYAWVILMRIMRGARKLRNLNLT